jgi:hypothetical protein
MSDLQFMRKIGQAVYTAPIQDPQINSYKHKTTEEQKLCEYGIFKGFTKYEPYNWGAPPTFRRYDPHIIKYIPDTVKTPVDYIKISSK